MFRILLLTILLYAGLVPASAEKAPPSNTVVFLAPPSSMKGDVNSYRPAVSTLQEALDMAETKFAAGIDHVQIRVLPGRYVRQRAKTAGAGSGRSITILSDGVPGSAVFDGEGTATTWLIVQGNKTNPANLTISGLRITRYSTAISLNGSRDKLDKLVSRVIIKNNDFDTIGQGGLSRGKPSTAVVRLVNADNNEILGNRFAHNRNVEECNALHALYLAHDSTGNTIKDNRFQDACGDSVRLRDGSNGNLVQDNRFEDAWAVAPVSSWFCDASRRRGCTKLSGECPAINNRVVGNVVIARALLNSEVTATFGPISTEQCPAPMDARHFLEQ